MSENFDLEIEDAKIELLSSSEKEAIGVKSFVPPQCSPWSLPLLLYIGLIVIALVLTVKAISRYPNKTKCGKKIDPNQKWIIGFIAVSLLIIVALIFGFWMYNLSKSCQYENAWIILLLAVLFPVILWVLTLIIISILAGLNLAMWSWAWAWEDWKEDWKKEGKKKGRKDKCHNELDSTKEN